MKIDFLSTVIVLLYASHSTAIHFVINDPEYTAVFDPTIFRNIPVNYIHSIEYYCSPTHQYSQHHINNVITYAKAIYDIRKIYDKHRRKKWYPVKKYINGFQRRGPFRIQPITPGSDIPPSDEKLYRDYVIMDLNFRLITIIYFVRGNFDQLVFNECFPLNPKRMISEVTMKYRKHDHLLPDTLEFRRIHLMEIEPMKRENWSLNIPQRIKLLDDKESAVKILSQTSDTNQLDGSTSSSTSLPINSDDNGKTVSSIIPSKKLLQESEQNLEPSKLIPMSPERDDRENSVYPNPMPISQDSKQPNGNPEQSSRSASPTRQGSPEVERGPPISRSSLPNENRNSKPPTFGPSHLNLSSNEMTQNQDSRSTSTSPNTKYLPEVDKGRPISASSGRDKEEERVDHQLQPNSLEEEHKKDLELDDNTKFPSLQEAQLSKSSPKLGSAKSAPWRRLERKKKILGNELNQKKAGLSKVELTTLDIDSDKKSNGEVLAQSYSNLNIDRPISILTKGSYRESPMNTNPMPVSLDSNQPNGNPQRSSRSASLTRQRSPEVERGPSRSRSSPPNENRNSKTPTLGPSHLNLSSDEKTKSQGLRSTSPNIKHSPDMNRGRSRSRKSERSKNVNAESPKSGPASPTLSSNEMTQNQDSRSTSTSPNTKYLPEVDKGRPISASSGRDKEKERVDHQLQPNSLEEEHKKDLELDDNTKFPSLQEAQLSKSSLKLGSAKNAPWRRLERKKRLWVTNTSK